MTKTSPSASRLFLSFLRLGLSAFGGPAMVSYIRELSVKRNKWLDDETFKDGVAITQSIPGATAMQMAAYAGLKSRGVGGALLSYIGFGLPAFVLMLILSALYEKSRNIAQIISLFNGLQVIVVAMVANAAYTFGKGTLKNYRDIFITMLSAILFWRGISPFIVIIGSALTGIAFLKDTGFMVPSHTRGVRDKQKLKQITLLALILLIGLLVLYFADTVLFKLATMMLRIDVFAFGGGFASLPLMLHEVVNLKGWMDQRTFMDGIALGQVTPGPIVITATFVGYLIYGFAGAIVATIAIFTPSFLILVMAAPFFDKLKASEYFSKATRGILASFVGLLLSVTLKFGLNISWDLIRVLFGLAAMTALMKKVDVLYVVLAGAVVSILIM
ncbi:MAG: chromate efflux transporter [Nitrospirae bacterium]|nr:chromate efflux transporter [Nitrospirota bacterium]